MIEIIIISNRIRPELKVLSSYNYCIFLIEASGIMAEMAYTGLLFFILAGLFSSAFANPVYKSEDSTSKKVCF